MSKDLNVPAFTQCPYCMMPYGQEAARVLKTVSRRKIVHLTCEFCSHSMLISLIQRKGGFVCAGMFTDCGPEDAQKFIEAEKISIDDVIDAHNALQFDNFMEMR